MFGKTQMFEEGVKTGNFTLGNEENEDGVAAKALSFFTEGRGVSLKRTFRKL